jgi:flagellin
MSYDSLSVGGISSSSDVYSQYTRAVESVASGDRLNRSSDGPAEMAISNELRGQIAEIQQGNQNIQDGVNMLQVAEGSLGIVSDNLNRMKQLAIQSQGSLYSDEQKKLIEREYAQLAEQNQQIAAGTSYNGTVLHQDGQTIEVFADGTTAVSFDTQGIPGVSPTLLDDPEAAIASIEAAAQTVNSNRADMGSSMNRLEKQSISLSKKSENLLASESRISNTDVARAASYKTAAQIMQMETAAQKAHNDTVQELASLFFS